MGQVVAHVAHADEQFVQQFIGKGGHPSLCVLVKAKRMHMVCGDVDQGAGCQSQRVAVQFGGTATVGDEQHLVQACMPMRGQLPIVQNRTVGDRLAVQHIGQVL